jgi:hypothetical protein
MSCELGRDGSSHDIAATFLRVRLRRDGCEASGLSLVTERLRSTGDLGASVTGASLHDTGDEQSRIDLAMRTVTLDDELAALLEGEKSLDEATREALVMDLSAVGGSQPGKASELPSLDRTALIRRANEHNVPVYLTTEKEWEADLTALDAWHDLSSLP